MSEVVFVIFVTIGRMMARDFLRYSIRLTNRKILSKVIELFVGKKEHSHALAPRVDVTVANINVEDCSKTTERNELGFRRQRYGERLFPPPYDACALIPDLSADRAKYWSETDETFPKRKEINKRDGNCLPGDFLNIKIGDEEAVFRYCPASKFLMGSPEDEAERSSRERQHLVTLTQGYWLQETPMTQALFVEVARRNPSRFSGALRPVERVSWNDCNEFIDLLNSRGYAPKGLEFDLPTEAEWECACRAAMLTPFNFGNTLNGDKAICNGKRPYGTTTKGRYIGETFPVKKYEPNAWGFYDMHGNVREWVSDWYDDYPSEAATDPTGPSSGTKRVARGGCWHSYAKHCRSAYRSRYEPSCRSDHIGFRLALRLVE